MQNYFYHYTSEKNAVEILGFERFDQDRTGLRNRKRFIRLGLGAEFNLPAKAYEGAVFGMLEPVCAGWAKNEWRKGEPVFHDVLWDMSGGDIVLLKVDVDTAKDDIYISDWGCHLEKDYDGTAYTDKNVLRRVKEEYYNSLCPWDQYFEEKRAYVIPEVVCFSAIEKERISIVSNPKQHAEVSNDFRKVGGFELLPVTPKAKPRDTGVDRFLKQLNF